MKSVKDAVSVTLQSAQAAVQAVRSEFASGQIDVSVCNGARMAGLKSQFTTALTALAGPLQVPPAVVTALGVGRVLGAMLEAPVSLMDWGPQLINGLVLMALVTGSHVVVAGPSWGAVPFCKVILYADPALLVTDPSGFVLCGPTASGFSLQPLTTIPLSAIDTTTCTVSTCKWLSDFDAHTKTCPVDLAASVFNTPPGFAANACQLFRVFDPAVPLTAMTLDAPPCPSLAKGLVASASATCCKSSVNVGQQPWLRWTLVGVGVAACAVLLIVVVQTFRKLSAIETGTSS